MNTNAFTLNKEKRLLIQNQNNNTALDVYQRQYFYSTSIKFYFPYKRSINVFYSQAETVPLKQLNLCCFYVSDY